MVPLKVMKLFRVRDMKKSVETVDAVDAALPCVFGIGFWWFLCGN